jgi:two-component system response regulator HydG
MPEPARLLVADDDPGLRESLERTLTREGYRVTLASDGRAALERVQAGGIDLILTDLKMPGLTGLELLRAAKAIAPDVDVILLTAFGTVEEAVKAMKDGAYDFLTKPFRREQLLKLIDKALERRALIEQNKVLRQQLEDLRGKGQVIGASPAFRRMMTLVDQVADSAATVLIQGESGTGKELVARAIHERSPRSHRPFVAVNCAALPETLLESELFGYEKGAFTGAVGRKEGRFELASGGTLFLDEVADLSLVTQPKILRMLQEGEFERLGGTRTLQVDVRIVAATNQNLAEMVKDKRFREDLYYRLNVITVYVPPLRDRPEDIRVLAQHFLRVYAAKNNRALEGFTPEAVERLESYAWPGNVRELENVVERAVVLARERRVGPEELPDEVTGTRKRAPRDAIVELVGTPLADIEQRLLDEALRITGGNKTQTAKLLGIDVRTVARKLDRREGPDEPLTDERGGG